MYANVSINIDMAIYAHWKCLNKKGSVELCQMEGVMKTVPTQIIFKIQVFLT